MLTAKTVRDTIVHGLKKERSGLVSIEIDGYLLAAADIAIPVKKGNSQSFRILVVPQNIENGKYKFNNE